MTQKRFTFPTLLFLVALLLAACGGANETVRTEPIEVTQVASETAAESAPVNTAAVESNESSTDDRSETAVSTVVEEVVVEAEEDAESAGEPIAVAPRPQQDETAVIAPPTPAATVVAPVDNFFANYGVNPYIDTNIDNLSTFSLDVDTGSYAVARSYLRDGLMPPPAAIRVEEFVNAFDQGYAPPADAGFSVYADGAPSPFHNDGTYFLRIGIQGYDILEEERAPANLVFVIDVSGSMAQDNRLGLVKESLQLLVNRLRPDDTVAIVVYGSEARVVLDATPGNRRADIMTGIYSLRTEGSTNLEAGLFLGYDIANRAYKPGGINRVILASDGVANVGDTSPGSLVDSIRGYADAGITLTTLGFGMGNFNDVMMEQLADDGEGQYAYIDTLAEAETLFVDNLMSTLQVIALDAKIQVEFDANVVQQYRLIGYENRAIADEDFRNDDIDAAEFGAGHTAAAVYAVQLVPGANGRIATVNLRWQEPQTRAVQEIRGDIFTSDLSASFDDAPLNHQLTVVVSQFAELLRRSYWGEGITMRDIQIRSDRLASQMGTAEAIELAELVAIAANYP